jgi:hypothetical protein
MGSRDGYSEVVVSAVGLEGFVLVKIFPFALFQSSLMLIDTITIKINKIAPISVWENRISKLITEYRNGLCCITSSQNLVLIQRS